MAPFPSLIRGLHEFKVELDSNSEMRIELDEFWVHENPNRYSVAVWDVHGRMMVEW